MITVEKINVFDEFQGDEDGLSRVGLKHQKELFEANDDWFILMKLCQDIHFINNQLASADYVKTVFARMIDNCDVEAYNLLMSKIIVR